MKLSSFVLFLFIALPLIIISSLLVIFGIYLSVSNHSASVIGQALVVVGSSVFIFAAKFINKR